MKDIFKFPFIYFVGKPDYATWELGPKIPSCIRLTSGHRCKVLTVPKIIYYPTVFRCLLLDVCLLLPWTSQRTVRHTSLLSSVSAAFFFLRRFSCRLIIIEKTLISCAFFPSNCGSRMLFKPNKAMLSGSSSRVLILLLMHEAHQPFSKVILIHYLSVASKRF